MCREIWQHYQNMKSYFIGPTNASDIEQRLRQWFDEQNAWMRGMINSSAAKDPFWAQAQFVVAQMDGLHAGYSSVADPSWVSKRIYFNLL